MNDQQKENWEKTRSKGMIRYVFEIGILRFALPVWVLTQIIMYVLEYGFTSSNIGELFTGRKIFFFFFGMLIAGVFFGLITWAWGEKNYQKLNQ